MYLFLATQDDRYEAEAQVLLSGSTAQRVLRPSSQNTGFLSREMSNEISLANSDVVTERAHAVLREEELEIEVSASEQADILIFLAESSTAERAAQVANVWAETYVDVKQDEAMSSVETATSRLQGRLEELRAERHRIREPLDALQDRILTAPDDDQKALMQSRYDRLVSELSYELNLLTSQSEAAVASLTNLELQAEVAAVGEARIIQTASPPTERSNSSVPQNLALAATAGLVLGAAVALLVEMRDTTIKSATDVQAIGLSVLAAIPEAPKTLQADLARITQADPEGMYADGFQKLRAAVEFVALGGQMRTVLITSPNAAEGKSTTASNLAVALASVSRTAALVDVDFRRGRVHNIYSISRSPGLSDHILGQMELGKVARRVEGADGLYVIPTGTAPSNPAAFVGLPGFASAINGVARQVNTVVLDAPPLLAVSDTYTMARNVDGVILTVRAGSTTKAELAEVLTVLAQVEANVLGVVMIGVKESETYGGRYYTRSHTGQLPAVGVHTGPHPQHPPQQVQVARDLSIVYDTNPPVGGRRLINSGQHPTVHYGTPPSPVTHRTQDNVVVHNTGEHQNPHQPSLNGSSREGERTAIFPGMFEQ